MKFRKSKAKRPPKWAVKPVPLCRLCRQAVRMECEQYCLPCRDHQERAAAVVARVNAGRKADSLSPAEVRGRGI